MPTLSAIVTLSADASTLGDVADFLRECTHLGLPPSTPLLDGGHTLIEDFPFRAGGEESDPDRDTLGALNRWCGELLSAGVPLSEPILVGGDALAVDLVPLGTELIGCGDCSLDPEPVDVLVTVHACGRS